MTGKERRPLKWSGFWIPAVVVFVLWALTGTALYHIPSRGTFGDMFGAVNALFSGLAFAGIIYAIYLQREDLRLQMRELQLSREELAGQRKELHEQATLLNKQTFEDTFFQLLRLHNDIVNMIDMSPSGREGDLKKGRDSFLYFYQGLGNEWNKVQKENQGSNEQDLINRAFLNFYDHHQSDLGHYFRSLYNIVKYVHRSDVADKKFYTNLIRAQISAYELLLLFYNCLSDLGSEKFRPLVETYGLLKAIPERRLLNPPDHVNLYLSSAYQAT